MINWKLENIEDDTRYYHIIKVNLLSLRDKVSEVRQENIVFFRNLTINEGNYTGLSNILNNIFYKQDSVDKENLIIPLMLKQDEYDAHIMGDHMMVKKDNKSFECYLNEKDSFSQFVHQKQVYEEEVIAFSNSPNNAILKGKLFSKMPLDLESKKKTLEELDEFYLVIEEAENFCLTLKNLMNTKDASAFVDKYKNYKNVIYVTYLMSTNDIKNSIIENMYASNAKFTVQELKEVISLIKETNKGLFNAQKVNFILPFRKKLEKEIEDNVGWISFTESLLMKYNLDKALKKDNEKIKKSKI